MKIHKYTYSRTGADGLSFSPITMQNVNLLVGATGAGKSKFLNTIFNLGLFAFRTDHPLSNGSWDIEFSEGEHYYRWILEIRDKNVFKENILEINDGETKVIVDRSEDDFIFTGTKLPKLTRNKVSSILLNEEEILKDFHNAFGKFYYKRFSDRDLQESYNYAPFIPEMINKDFTPETLPKYFTIPINLKLFLMEKYFHMEFKEFWKYYIEIFPFVERMSIEIKESLIPVPYFKEKGVNKLIPLSELSSGMRKVLMVLTDLLTMHPESVYLIDEYENSLGVNAINFLPNYISSFAITTQFIMTSHHPYVINSIDPSNWFVFGRKANDIKILFGDEVIKRYGKSKQKAFIQLVNDEFFLEGVE